MEQNLERNGRQRYQDKLEEVKASRPHDALEMSGARAVWKEVLAVYAVKTTTDTDGADVASVDEGKIRLLSEVFWEMNQITSSVEARTETVVDTAAGEDGELVDTETTVTQDVLVITVSHKTTWEMADLLHFDQNQREQLRELLSEEYDGLWNELLYGIAVGSGDLVAVALSQVGQVGGESYWSWYGFGSRVEWCACFVSWCIFRPSESKETVGVSPHSREKQVQVHGRESTGVLFGKKWQRNASQSAPPRVIYSDWNPFLLRMESSPSMRIL